MTHQELDTQFDERLARESDPKEASPQKHDVKETTTPRSLQLRQKILDRLPVLKERGMCRVPNQKFWEYYREPKAELSAACIGIRKDDAGNSQIVAYPYENITERYEREIAEMRAKHRGKCQRCFSECHTIRKRLMSNGMPLFKFKCVACGRETGSSLPHQLVDYLVQEQDFDLLINDA